MDTSDFGTLKGFQNLLQGTNPAPAAPAVPASSNGTVKIPLAALPPDVQAGQQVTITVVGVDPINGVATISPIAPTNTPGVTKAPDAVDKSVTMGSMDALKSYLLGKTQDQEQENQ